MNSKRVARLFGLCLTAGGIGSLSFGCGGGSGQCGEVGPCYRDATILIPGSGGLPVLATGGTTEGGGNPGSGGGIPAGGGGISAGTGGAPAGSGGVPAGSGGSTVVACGEAGTPCCDGNSCTGGGCCVSGICMAVGGSCVGLGNGTCGAGACGTCGGLGQPCCTSAAGATACTAPSTKCSAGTCAKCGELGGPCCASASGTTGLCNSPGSLCDNNVCIACGTPGSKCCPGSQCGSPACCYNDVCVGEATTCGTAGGTCQAGRCSGCGGKGQPCCANLCYDGLLCNAGACTSCGGSGEICCPASVSTTPCQAGTACTTSGSTSVCARCGSLGDICCAGNACTDGCCSGGRCVATTSCTTPDAATTTDAPIVSTGGVAGSGGVTGTGGVSGSGGSSGTGGCGALIDDMEAGTGRICSSRYGMWFTYVDSGTSSIITPTPGTAALPELMSTARTTTSKYAMHMSGYYSTYAGMGCWLNNTSFSTIPGTYNAAGYTGIRFYAKGSGSMQVTGQMPSTESTTYGGTCTLGASVCTGNSYLIGALSSAWTLYTVPFASLTGGSATPFSPSSIWSLEFGFYSSTSLGGVSFDLWVDDLTFY